MIDSGWRGKVRSPSIKVGPYEMCVGPYPVLPLGSRSVQAWLS
jgi:hypothetical protein